ncbi:spore germination protein [Ruminiclostridium papyrosolvens DSM 2782]|uniref:Spore germination protein n=1 Tax=Ruminiclostridium papyrosolvens DSM 2782 TaxID=588581 RepID=F1TIU8_9FIRM|nr:endospore germination permease [Ruminiclostridium papyrosolvens]EGD45677.1 spore germination protein [Ruminiclostridium papyrosolvens DSM 2782]WES35879.1 endospore germination permease [Ruminiclostridium papyrosolvens DSM 2782]
MNSINKVKLSNFQLAVIAIGYFHASTTISNPAIGAKRDAWLAIILGTLGGFIVITMLLYLSKVNKGKNLVEIIEYCFGKTTGKILCLIYILYFLHAAILETEAFSEFMVTVSYPETPIVVIVLVLIIIAVYAARSGLSVIAKSCEVLVPLLPMAIAVVTLSLLNVTDFTGLKPSLIDIPPVIKSAVDLVSSVFADYIVFLMILPYTNSEKGRFKATYWATGITGLILLVISSRNLQIIGPALIEYVRYPSHIAAQLIPAISIDPLVDMNLLIGGGIKVLVSLYAISRITAEIFNIEYKPLVPAFGLLIITLSIWAFPNAMELYSWEHSFAETLISLPPQVLLPLILLIISLIKNKKQQNGQKIQSA